MPNTYCKDVEPNTHIEKYEMPLAKTLLAYMDMPLGIGPAEGVNNLVQAFCNKRYMTIEKRFNTIIDSDMVKKALEGFYGPELVRRCFGEKVMPYQLRRIGNWTVLSPERYALLATMIGQAPRMTFSAKPIPDRIEEKLVKLSLQEVPLTKKEIAEQMNVKTHQLDFFLGRYDMEPFWANAKKGNDGQDEGGDPFRG